MSDFDQPMTPQGGDTSLPSVETTPSTPQGAATPAPAAASPTSGAPQIPQGYVPSYRIRETRESALREAQQFVQQREAEWQARYDQVQRQLQALTGVLPQQTSEHDQIREQFFQIFPWAKKLEARYGDIEKVLERSGDLEAQADHYWTSYGQQTMNSLFSKASEALGGELTDDAKRHLHGAFTQWVQSSPALTERYTKDPSIVDEFLRGFTSSFIDPVRRQSLGGVAQRAAAVQHLPQDTPGGPPRMQPAPQPKDMNERADLAWQLYQQTANTNART